MESCAGNRNKLSPDMDAWNSVGKLSTRRQLVSGFFRHHQLWKYWQKLIDFDLRSWHVISRFWSSAAYTQQSRLILQVPLDSGNHVRVVYGSTPYADFNYITCTLQ